MARLFKKGREKTGGRKAGTPNKATTEIKEVLDDVLPDPREKWRKFLNHKDPAIAWKAFELYHHYRFGKPVQPLTTVEEKPFTIHLDSLPKKFNA